MYSGKAEDYEMGEAIGAYRYLVCLAWQERSLNTSSYRLWRNFYGATSNIQTIEPSRCCESNGF